MRKYNAAVRPDQKYRQAEEVSKRERPEGAAVIFAWRRPRWRGLKRDRPFVHAVLGLARGARLRHRARKARANLVRTDSVDKAPGDVREQVACGELAQIFFSIRARVAQPHIVSTDIFDVAQEVLSESAVRKVLVRARVRKDGSLRQVKGARRGLLLQVFLAAL